MGVNQDSVESAWLTGLTVLDFTDERGLLAGQMFARLGADVIQVEPLEGSPARKVGPFSETLPPGENSYVWQAFAAGKRGVALHPSDPAARMHLSELVKSADFLIESGGGALEQFGLTAADARSINPALITVGITAYGEDGPKAGNAATDLTLWAASGAIFPSRDGVSQPVGPSVPQAWLHAATDAACGAMIAHFARKRSGRGQHVSIAAVTSLAAATLSYILHEPIGHDNYIETLGLDAPRRMNKDNLDMSGSGSRSRRNKWELKDGILEMNLALGAAAGRFTNNLMAWLREEGALSEQFAEWDWVTLPEKLVSEEIDVDLVEVVREEVANHLRKFTKQEILQVALDKKLLLSPIMTVADLVSEPHHFERGNLLRQEETGAPVMLVGAFAKNLPAVTLRPAPRLGQHNAEILEGRGGTAGRETALQTGGTQ